MARALHRLIAVFVMILALPATGMAAGGGGSELSLLWVVPFVGILLSIALFPLLKPSFWHHHFGKVSAFWALAFLIPYLVSHGFKVTLDSVLHVYVLEFVPFLILLFALYTTAGGIRLRGRLRGSPMVNLLILVLGTFLASWMGTTGAAMLLIRPLLRANEWRKRKTHLVVFFIFLVANIGGSLTPLGDPPLFLGFLYGVHFFWTTEHLFLPMLTCVIPLLGLFFVMDKMLLAKEEQQTPPSDGNEEALGLEGTINFLLLAGVIGAILYSGSASKDEAYFDSKPVEEAKVEVAAKTAVLDGVAARIKSAKKEDRPELVKELLVAGAEVNAVREEALHAATKGWHLTDHVTWPFINMVRDGLLILMGVLSLFLTSREVRRRNDFTWFPIVEVGKLFAGIFITIIPAIAILKAGPNGALRSVVLAVTDSDGGAVNAMYFWLTGGLSSFLDNAPTYLVFFNTAGGNADQLMDAGATTLLAVSAGAVFMGAMTYIGNAPNFMVRSIAEEAGIPMPSFFGYLLRWSLPILLPVLILMSIIFFH